MIPLTVVFGLLLAVFGFVGLARRFPVELGATIGFTAMLFSLLLGAEVIGSLSVRAASAVGIGHDESLVRWFALTLYIAVWVGFMYVGQTLTFAGAWPPNRVVGTVLDLTIGVFNGWLVLGTWWHYTDQLDYPVQQLGWFVPPLSARAETLVAASPPALVPAGLGTWVVGGFLVFLIALRVFR